MTQLASRMFEVSLESSVNDDWNKWIKNGIGYEIFAIILGCFIIFEVLCLHCCCRCCRNKQKKYLNEKEREYSQASRKLTTKKREFENERNRRVLEESKDDDNKAEDDLSSLLLSRPKKSTMKKGKYLDRMIAIYERSKVTGDILIKINNNGIKLNVFEYESKENNIIKNGNDSDSLLLDSQEPGLVQSSKTEKKKEKGKGKGMKKFYVAPIASAPPAMGGDDDDDTQVRTSVIAMGALDEDDEKIYLTTDDGALSNNNKNKNDSCEKPKNNKKNGKIEGLGKTCMKTRSDFLIAASDVFAGMLNPESHFIEFQSKEILLNNCNNIRVADDFCYFLITNQLRYDCDALQMLKIADCYQIKSLSQACIQRLISERGLTVKSFIEIVTLFERLGIQSGFDKIISFGQRHKNDIAKDPKFKELPVSFRCGVLGFENDDKTTSLLFGS